MQKLASLLMVLIASSAWALDDGFVSPALGSGKPGWTWALAQRVYDRAFWIDTQNDLVVINGAERIVDADSLTKTARGFRMDATLAWQATPRDAFVLSLPWYFQEFSPPSGSGLSSMMNDAAVRRGDGPGDTSLAWRRVVISRSSEQSQMRLGAFFEASIPSGLGPFAAAHPLVATGSGSFTLTPGLGLELRWHSLGFSASASGTFDLGAQHDIPLGSVIAYRSDPLGPLTLPGGRAYTRRDPDFSVSNSLDWAWHRDEGALHKLIIEARYSRRGAIQVEGVSLEGSQGADADLIPQAAFEFKSGLGLRLGWALPLVYNQNRALTPWGELLARLEQTW